VGGINPTPGHLNASQALQGLLRSAGQTRDGLTIWVRRFRQLEEGYAAPGDRLRQALCRGQALGAEHTAAMLDEEIIEAFGLWQQYEAQVPGPGNGSDRSAAPPQPGSAGLVPGPREKGRDSDGYQRDN
jgi:hypothetical protein